MKLIRVQDLPEHQRGKTSGLFVNPRQFVEVMRRIARQARGEFVQLWRTAGRDP